jgi:hypothetical protein
MEVGKRVVTESESTDRRPRPGVIEEVLHGDPSPRDRIRWDTAARPSTRPRAAPFEPNNAPSGPQTAITKALTQPELVTVRAPGTTRRHLRSRRLHPVRAWRGCWV